MDASDSHVGSVLQQRVDDAWFPLAFFSKKLLDAEKKYSAFDRELLAAYSSIRHFRYMLEGREFMLVKPKFIILNVDFTLKLSKYMS